MGASHPGSFRITSVLVLEHPFQHQDFLTSVMAVRIEDRSRIPANQRGVPGFETGKRHDGKTPNQPGKPLRISGIDNHLFTIADVEMAKLDENGASFFRTGGMHRPWRIPEIGTGAVIPGFVAENSFEHEDFLAEIVDMGGKTRARRKPHDRCRAARFSSIALDHSSFHAGCRTRHPRKVFGLQHDALRKVDIEFDRLHFSCPGCVSRILPTFTRIRQDGKFRFWKAGSR